MDDGPALPRLIKQARVHRFCLMKALIVAAQLGVTAASAQDTTNTDNRTSAALTQQLYDCGSLYAVLEKCYSSDNTDQGKKASVVARDNKNRSIHLTYVYGTRAGISSDDLLKNMHSSIETMMGQMGHECKNVSLPLKNLGQSCANLLKNPPQQPDDRRIKSGDIGSFMPASID